MTGNPEVETVSKDSGEDIFFAEHAGRAYNLALRLSGNPTDAEDLAQEALIRALKALPAFRGDAAGSTWVFRIVVNVWKNRVRAEKRRKLWQLLPLERFFGRDEEESEEAFKADDPPLDAGLQTAETAAEVQKALLKLDEESRAVVVLREIEGLPYEKIAQALDLPEGTVKSRLSRARAALREQLKAFVQAGG
ncbi:MAG: sigma-70 family RNA polymerase sigma factor [Elusimicrobia bacterium]|nr:sigma-70 family RNA polymerase sigma factor [Elusimicrobiota bacterium]